MNALLQLTTAATLLASLSGCHWLWQGRPTYPQAPVAFQEQPTLEKAMATVNANSGRVYQLSSEGVALTTDNLPSLRADIALERPKRFRLRASLTSLTGQELDIGGNDELFWVWLKRSQPPAMFYARHSETHLIAAKELVPIEPTQIIEALGLVDFDPAGRHEGPFPRGDDKLEIRSRVNTPDGEKTKATIIHATYGWVLEQHLLDDNGRPKISVRASEHRFYPEAKVTLPHRVDVRIPDAGVSLRLDVNRYQINQLAGDPAQLWAMPKYDGYPLVNLTDPRLQMAPLGDGQPAPETSRPAAFRPSYRGYTRSPRRR